MFPIEEIEFSHGSTPSGCIAVQAFNKADSVLATLDSISKCRGAQNYFLLILQDGLAGSKRLDRYSDSHTETRSVLESWVATNRSKFRGVKFQAEAVNRGTCATAEVIINRAFARSDYVIFTEDDVLFEPDAIVWFETALNSVYFSEPDVWVVAGESKIFDSGLKTPTQEHLDQALIYARETSLISKIIYYDFMPSSCFATVRSKWDQFGSTRGGPNGDRDVNTRCRLEGKKSLWPIVARCRDVGMHHPLGYSMRVKKSNPELVAAKNTYVTSGMFESGDLQLREIGKEAGLLFAKYTKSWRV